MGFNGDELMTNLFVFEIQKNVKKSVTGSWKIIRVEYLWNSGNIIKNENSIIKKIPGNNNI